MSYGPGPKVDPTWLDRAIFWLSPEWGSKRIFTRAAKAYYDGATIGRRGASIRRSIADPNAVTARTLPRLRHGSRDLHRNNAHVRRGTESIVSNTVGTGIRPKFLRDGRRDEGLQRLAKRHLETTACDSDGRLTFYGLQYVAFWACVEAGEVLIRRRYRRSSDGLPVPVQYQVLEADFLDESKDGPTANGGEIVQGVEFDAIGRRRAYWIFDRHPGSTRGHGVSRPIPARDIIHLARMDRPGQVRGIPWVAPVMLRIADYSDYVDAQVVRQKIAACFAVFIEEAFDNPGAAANAAADLIETLEPGIVERLPPGTEAKFGTPPGVEGYQEFSGVTLREIAAGRGISYEMMTGDLRGVNFSSGKMGRVEAQRNIDTWQQLLIIPDMCDPMIQWFLEAAELAGEDIDGVEVRHTPPAREMIDPPREGRAEREMIRGGQKTLFQALRERGLDPAEHLREYREALELLDELGIIVDSDARQRTGSGNAVQTGGGPGDDPAPNPDPGNRIQDALDRIEDLEDRIASLNGAHG